MNMPTDSALRTLDVAAATLTPAEQQRALTALDGILATSPANPMPAAAPAVPAVRLVKRRRSLGLAAAGVLGLFAASVVFDGSGSGSPAYASWTATPVAVSAVDLGRATSACRDKLRDYDSLDADRAEIALAERRGDYVALLFRTDNPDMAGACLLHNAVGSTELDDLHTTLGGGTGPALKAPAASFTQGAVSQFQGASITDGAIGAQVTGVTIHAGNVTVDASVQNGRYAAWWPGPAFEDTDKPSGGSESRLMLTYDLTLIDGTVVLNAQPTRPS